MPSDVTHLVGRSSWGDGFAADDIARLLDHVPGHVLVLRPVRDAPIHSARERRAGRAGAGTSARWRLDRARSLCQWLERLATRLTVVASTPVPNTYDNSAWRRAVRRIGAEPMSVSETWNVIPIVNAR
jgi:hypothetical protein